MLPRVIIPWRLITAFAALTTHHHVCPARGKSFWKLHGWNVAVEAIGSATIVAEKVNMIIVMVACHALILAKRVLHRIVRRRYGVDDAFLNKGLQRPVDRHTVELVATHFLNVGMRQRTIRLQEMFKYLFPAICYAQLIPLQYI
jgi:hypothetical protein